MCTRVFYYYGVYYSDDREQIWEEDHKKRYFSFIRIKNALIHHWRRKLFLTATDAYSLFVLVSIPPGGKKKRTLTFKATDHHQIPNAKKNGAFTCKNFNFN